MKKHEIPHCEFCGKVKKNQHGKNHSACSIISRRLRECKPENIPWVKAQIKEKYGVDVK